MMGARVFPSANDVARAIGAAARLLDEDPFAVAHRKKSRARFLALGALCERLELFCHRLGRGGAWAMKLGRRQSEA
ncbi:hypothetical protein [Chelativorans sp. M5D2P16]|uniref:hypothetical protein n=1 Tax=Chelativorans sp. M5D2P16 TaxID=3095678 RepID=UPI002AC9F7CA|nr:hypothetical protein [Chelativorans sp. M5D2P16]MDZ5697822.1 hypothetical protein [Chelativorans sp. M5D2P16]